MVEVKTEKRSKLMKVLTFCFGFLFLLSPFETSSTHRLVVSDLSDSDSALTPPCTVIIFDMSLYRITILTST